MEESHQYLDVQSPRRSQQGLAIKRHEPFLQFILTQQGLAIKRQLNLSFSLSLRGQSVWLLSHPSNYSLTESSLTHLISENSRDIYSFIYKSVACF
jgi:hypothetical protein